MLSIFYLLLIRGLIELKELGLWELLIMLYLFGLWGDIDLIHIIIGKSFYD